MKEKNKKEAWRKLDNSAKIFPLQESNKYSTVFRYSAVLKEEVDKDVLEKAVEKALIRYSAFKVRLRRGVFWYYLENNPKKVVVSQEKYYPCKKIDPAENNNYLFSVTYFEKKINVEIFHSLTDGNGGLIFFREIIYNYLDMKHEELQDKDERRARKIEFDTEDSYVSNYDKKSKNNRGNRRAYILKGKELKFGQVSVNHLLINTDDLKKECVKYDLSTTQYLTSVLIWSIYNANILKYYRSKTMSNFFSYISVDAEMETCVSFEKISDFVRSEFEKKLSEEEILKTMSGNVKIGQNFFIGHIPFFLKKIIIRGVYREIQKYLSITYSNIGKVGIIGKYQKYIDCFLLLIAPERIEKIKCSSCTYVDKVIFTFTSVLNDNSIEKYLYGFLKAQKVKVSVESNEVLDSIESGEKNAVSKKDKEQDD